MSKFLIDNRAGMLPAYEQVVIEGEKQFNTGCETNFLAHDLHHQRPIDGGWQPGMPYAYSRAGIEYFDNLERGLGRGLDRTIKAAMKWGVLAEKDWPSHVSNYRKRPPPEVMAKATFPIKGYTVINGAAYEDDLVFAQLQAWLETKRLVGSYLELAVGAVAKIRPDGIMPNFDSPTNYRHIVPLWGKVEKLKNPDWYGFRNHAGTGWGDHGDFYLHRSYMDRHLKVSKFYLVEYR